MPALFTRRRKGQDAVTAAHFALINQARQPLFYTDYGVPDTLDGRFELIILHAFLLMHRLKGQGEAAKRFSQDLFDYLFMDLDNGLRELGVGDLVVGKRIKVMAEGFYGRVAAYEKGLAAADDTALRTALDYNLYGTRAAAPEQLARMVGYVRQSAALLAGQEVAALVAGRVVFLGNQTEALQ